MTDTTNSSSTKTQSGKQDPLAVLENILNEAKNRPNGSQSATKVGDAEPGAKRVDTGPSPEELAEAEAEKQRQAEAEKQRQAQLEAERLRLIEAQKQKLEHELKQTPQYQARVEQEKQRQAEQKKHQEAGDGYEIRQLGHTKI